MPLNDELLVFLDLAAEAMANGSRSAIHDLPPDLARREYEAASQILDVPGPEMASVQELSIEGRDGYQIGARLYKPLEFSETTDPQPVLLYFHGGGYCLGSLDSHDALCRSLAALTPCYVLHIAYRLAPENRFPSAVHDAHDGYQWLLRQGLAYGLDTSRIAVGGDSVGGSLATGITIMARDKNLQQPVCQLLLYPCTSAWQDSESHRRLASGYLLEAKTLQWMFNFYLRTDADRVDWRFAPLEAPDLSKLAPAHLVLAEFDPLLDEGMAYAERLLDSGVVTQVHVYSGMVHDFARLSNIVEEAEEVRQDLAKILAKAFYPENDRI
ncbi:acetyl esterase [Nitrosomonas sp. PY1]|uniref:alpha/beta hydrolase n=1 Tax=Nitrosomonas sp. PY1 TaxID=1803906 RepID=UPI001FC81FD1|nr:alpha/beta hydrolase [Nitrosomonas sp. PY1]GKS68597.1 acetyl esterase [Nitrosomonas sp. PY1]